MNTFTLRTATTLPLYFGGSFLLHLLWENLQMPLYAGFENTALREHFWMCFRATITGDMLFMFVIYAALAVIHQDIFWISNYSTFKNPVTWMITLLIGGFLGVSFELWAVYVDHRWSYAEAMPLVPIIQVGLTPVLQMLIIPLVVLLLSRSVSRFSE